MPKKPTQGVSIVFDYIDRTVDAVRERGYDDVDEDWDDFADLVRTFEYRKLVTFQLYDTYFPPKRHEYELALLTAIVDAVVSNPAVIFLSGAVAGNAAYDLLKVTVSHTAKKFGQNRRSRRGFSELGKNVKRLGNYFATHEQATMAQLTEALGVEPERLQPILELLGFRRKKKGKRMLWRRPASWVR
jgi:hypothetical protein